MEIENLHKPIGRMLRAKDLSEIFVGIDASTVTQWAKKGILDCYRIGGSNFYKESDILKLIENSRIDKEI